MIAAAGPLRAIVQNLPSDAWSPSTIAAAVAAFMAALAAGCTAWMAWETRQLAQASRLDVEAQWRPVLVDDGGIVWMWAKEPGFRVGTLEVNVRNVGTGPAMNVRYMLESLCVKVFEPIGPIWISGVALLGTIAPGASKLLKFELTPLRPEYFGDAAGDADGVHHKLMLEYEDLSFRPLTTSVKAMQDSEDLGREIPGKEEVDGRPVALEESGRIEQRLAFFDQVVPSALGPKSGLLPRE